MQTPGFANAPVSQFLLYSLVISSVLVSIGDVKYLFHIQIVPHLWRWRQWWRLLIWQLMYANAGEVLFGTLAIYNLRVIERLWGSRKFASFLTYIFATTSLIAPLLLGTIFRPLTAWRMNYLPPGPTPLIFAILAQYHATIPHVYKFRIAAPLPASTQHATPAAAAAAEDSETAITLSDKFYVYLVAAQLAFTQPPASLLGAAVGWLVGYAWRADLMPGGKSKYPAWMFGTTRSASSRDGGYEGLRRVARGADTTAAGGTGAQAGPSGTQPQNREQGHTNDGGNTSGRPLGTQILDQFRGAF